MLTAVCRRNTKQESNRKLVLMVLMQDKNANKNSKILQVYDVLEIKSFQNEFQKVEELNPVYRKQCS